MSPATATRPISVRGGTNGIVARMDELTRLAGLYGSASEHCGAQSLTMQRYLVDPVVVASAVFDPVGAARFELAMAAALDGPHGLSLLALDCAATDAALRCAATAYTVADCLDTEYAPAIEGVIHARAAFSAFRAADKVGGWRGLRRGGDAAITTDPYAIDSAIATVSQFWPRAEQINLVRLLVDGHPDVRSVGLGTTPAEQAPPRSLANLFTALAVRYTPSEGGDVDVRFVYTTDAAGHVLRRAIVDIPGMRKWDVPTVIPHLPVEPDPTNTVSSLKSVYGQSTTYEQGVLEAMRKAGVTRGEPVLLVSHSLGGMVAANIAATMAKTREFHVTAVATAGAPIGNLPIPRAVTALSLENEGDIVPHCDGDLNPDGANQTTVTIHRNHGDILDDHDLALSYVPGAADVDASDDPSVRSYLNSIRGFLSGDRVVTHVYHVARVG